MKYLSPIKTKQPVKTKQKVPPIGLGDVKEEEHNSREYASPRKGPATGGSSVKIHPTEIAETQLLETSDLEDDKVVQIFKLRTSFQLYSYTQCSKTSQWALALLLIFVFVKLVVFMSLTREACNYAVKQFKYSLLVKCGRLCGAEHS